jgi:hypothetical protein
MALLLSDVCIHTKDPLTPTEKRKFSLGKAQLFIECHLPHGLVQSWIFSLQPTAF